MSIREPSALDFASLPEKLYRTLRIGLSVDRAHFYTHFLRVYDIVEMVYEVQDYCPEKSERDRYQTFYTDLRTIHLSTTDIPRCWKTPQLRIEDEFKIPGLIVKIQDVTDFHEGSFASQLPDEVVTFGFVTDARDAGPDHIEAFVAIPGGKAYKRYFPKRFLEQHGILQEGNCFRRILRISDGHADHLFEPISDPREILQNPIAANYDLSFLQVLSAQGI